MMLLSLVFDLIPAFSVVCVMALSVCLYLCNKLSIAESCSISDDIVGLLVVKNYARSVLQ